MDKQLRKITATEDCSKCRIKTNYTQWIEHVPQAEGNMIWGQQPADLGEAIEKKELQCQINE